MDHKKEGQDFTKLWLCSEMIEQSVCPWNFCKLAMNGVLPQRYNPQEIEISLKKAEKLNLLSLMDL